MSNKTNQHQQPQPPPQPQPPVPFQITTPMYIDPHEVQKIRPNLSHRKRAFYHKSIDLSQKHDFVAYTDWADTYFYSDEYISKFPLIFRATTVWHCDLTCLIHNLLNPDDFFNDHVDTFVKIPKGPCFILQTFILRKRTHVEKMMFPCPICVLQNPNLFIGQFSVINIILGPPPEDDDHEDIYNTTHPNYNPDDDDDDPPAIIRGSAYNKLPILLGGTS